MAMNDGERLRQLVGDHYHGLISTESYRDQRAELLDDIGDQVDERSATITKRQLSKAAEGSPEAGPGARDTATSTSGAAPKKGLTIALAMVGIAAAGYLVATQVFQFGGGPTPVTGQDVLVPESGLARGEGLLTEFMSRNDWSEDTISNFLLAWEALDEDQRRLANEGRHFRRFATTLHQRIREEIALGNLPGSGRLEYLTEFAATIGAPYKEYTDPAIEDSVQTEAEVHAEQQHQPTILDAGGDESDNADRPVEDAEELAEEDVLPVVATEHLVEEVEQAIDETPADLDTVRSNTAPPVTTVEDPCPANIAQTRRPYCQDQLSDGSKGPPLAMLPAGAFQMGNDRVDSESPMHRVEISHNIAMSRFEITADEYAEFCAATSLPCPAAPWSGSHPAVSVSWDDAILYTEWLSEATGFRYRLPSEAEWEYAARGGTETPYYFGDEITPSAALSLVNGRVEEPLPVSDRSINRNPFRLYHMSGNVREWTLDAWYPDYESAGSDGSARVNDAENSRVVRGGSYSDPGDRLRSAAREALDRSHRDNKTGFRVLREVVATTD